MVEFTVFKTKVKINYLFAAAITLLSLIDNSGYLFLSFAFSILHELGHLAAAALCGEQIEEISFRAYGIAVNLSKAGCLTAAREFFVLISGCAVNLLCAVIFRAVPSAFYINAAICVFNILPIGNLDGGRMLHLVLSRRTNQKTADAVCVAISFLLLVPLSVFGFLTIIKTGKFSLFLCSVYLVLTVLKKGEHIILKRR